MSTTTLTRDEQLDTAQPVWPPLDQESVTAAWHGFGHGGAPDLQEPMNRMMTGGAIIQGPQRRYFLKRTHRSVTSRQALEAKHAFANALKDQLAALRREGEVVPDVVRYHHGPNCSTVFEADEWYYELQDFAAGEPRYGHRYCWEPANTSEEMYGFGQALAHLHHATEQLAASHTRRLPADPGIGFYEWRCDFVPRYCREGKAAVTDFLADRPLVARWLEETGRDLEADLERYLVEPIDPRFADLPVLWIHGDGHVSNVAFDGQRVTSFYDFGLSCPSPLVADLATALERNTIAWLDVMEGNRQAYSLEYVDAMLAGYLSVRDLSEVERVVLSQLVSSIQVEPALNLIGYHQYTTRPVNAQWSYEIYFKAHSTWFTTEPGLTYRRGLRAALQL